MTNRDTPRMKTVPALNWRDESIAAILSGLIIALYVRTLAPTVLYGDSGEFQTLAYTLGMTHPTGYPVYVLFTRLFTFLWPLGEYAWRVNLFSAITGGLAMGALYLVGRLLGVRTTAALAGPIVLATSGLYWHQSVIAELYAPAALMITLILLLVLLWHHHDPRTVRQRHLAAVAQTAALFYNITTTAPKTLWSNMNPYLYWAGLLGGLSVGIHNTVTLIAPSIALYLLLARARGRDWLGAIGGSLLGLGLALLAFFLLDWIAAPSSYFEATVRHSLSAWGWTAVDFDTPLERLTFDFSAVQFRSLMFQSSETEFTQSVGRFVEELLRNFSILSLAMIPLGALALLWHRPKEALMLLLANASLLTFALNYRLWDIEVFYIPIYVLSALFISQGVSTVIDWLSRLLPPEEEEGNGEKVQYVETKGAKTRPVVRWITNTLGLLLTLALIVPNLSDIERSWQRRRLAFLGDRRYADYPYPITAPDQPGHEARLIVNQLEDNALLLTDWGMLYVYYYVAHVEQRRTGMSFYEIHSQEGLPLPQTMLTFLAEQIEQRPVYISDEPPGLEQYFAVTAAGNGLFRLDKRGNK